MELFHLYGVVGDLVVYEDKIVIIRKGRRAVKIYGMEEKREIPIRQIRGIKYRAWTPLVRGCLYFWVEGGAEGNVGLTGDMDNTVLFKQEGNEVAKKIKNYIEQRIIEEKNSAGDEFKKLKELKELLDTGIIEKNEFDEKKRQLLGLEKKV